MEAVDVMIILFFFYAYILIGLIVGLWFIFKGVQKVDEGMENAKLLMRLILLPGSIGLWPILLVKYIRSK